MQDKFSQVVVVVVVQKQGSVPFVADMLDIYKHYHSRDKGPVE